MADEIIKTVENVDRLFSEIVVNGESHVSNNYVPPVQLEQTVPQASEEEEEHQNTTPAQNVQGQDVYAVELNSVHHDFTDRDLTQDLADEITARQTADGNLQTAINGVSGDVETLSGSVGGLQTSVENLQGAVSTIQGKIPSQASSENQLADKDFVDTSIEQAIAEAGSGIEVYPTEEAIIQDLPNLKDGDIVATYGDEYAVNDVPLGSIIAYWGTQDPVDKKWLVLDGRDTTGTDIELQTHYPSLYLHLGGTNVLPDLRECVPVGIGQNGTDTIATHDVYTLGQFKDDQMQDWRSSGQWRNFAPSPNNGWDFIAKTTGYTPISGRYGTTTHGKQKGVNWIIKAVSTADVTPLPSESIQEIEGYVEEYVDEKVSDIDNFKIIESSGVSVTLNANAGNFVTVSITVPNGYKSMFMTGYDISGCSGGINVYATESQAFFNKTGTFTAKIWVRNYTSSQLTATSITAHIMCLKQ